ncbi:hypothetical protein HJC23_000743 [Cyclotella cryptica]|uniref:THIF-type NAD/FAD binding fold domain-containing protein n=1 Tax=Cyclotella cryptica TaxID=29204 RepID=A0ABD3NJE8_9STRA|eukprot:CCRYP_020760-RA/>CCRYP_020760-RA protein AED:0.22 eAED:0.22 QI:0/-1/0/1/-1/1/1/0/645
MATTNKYDRQLRLWGSSGQQALSSTLVVLIGASTCGTESLKNLVLPGVGSFLIVDDVVFDGAGGNGEIVRGESNNGDGKFSNPSCNFFAERSSGSGSSTKAGMSCDLLCELNPDVSGCHCTMPSLEGVNYHAFLEELKINPPAVDGGEKSKNILVICADQPGSVLVPLSHACHSLSLPLMNVRCYGLLGYIRIQTSPPYHVVRDAKKTNKLVDLRLSDGPAGVFPGLKKVYDSIPKLDQMTDSKDHGHVPYIIILLQALEKWRETNASGVPVTYDEKEEFRKLVKSMAKDYENELNFQEGYDQAHLAWANAKISDESKIVLDRCCEEEFYENAIDAAMDTSSGDASSTTRAAKLPSMTVLQFQLMALALKRFLKENDDRPPLEGTIPDMTSDTKTFVALQEAYRHQAGIDRSKITQYISEILEQCKLKSNGCRVFVEMPSDEEIVTFCKNARDIRILETRPLYAEYQCQDPSSPIVTALSKSLTLDSSTMPNFDTLQSESREDLLMSTMDPYETDPIQTPLLWFVALRACDAFYDRHGHYPGKYDQTLALEADVTEVYKLMVEVVGNMGLKECEFIVETFLRDEKGKNVAREVVRYDEAEIHTIAAVMGGVASQEAVKLITGQYVPLDDTYVYNGIASTAGVYRF